MKRRKSSSSRETSKRAKISRPSPAASTLAPAILEVGVVPPTPSTLAETAAPPPPVEKKKMEKRWSLPRNFGHKRMLGSQEAITLIGRLTTLDSWRMV